MVNPVTTPLLVTMAVAVAGVPLTGGAMVTAGGFVLE